MGDNTKISWADATWNPIRARNIATGKTGWYCEKVTAACDGCYAERLNMKGGSTGGTGLAYKPGHRNDVEIYLADKALLHPLSWSRPRRIFPCSMTDIFAPFVSDEWLDRIFAVMALTPRHTYQVLTKRPERARAYITDMYKGGRNVAKSAREMPWKNDIEAAAKGDLVLSAVLDGPLPNVWIGTSICEQKDADKFITEILWTPAAVLFVSAGPTLGPINLLSIRSGDTSDAGVYRITNALTGEFGHMGPCGPTWTGMKGPALGWVIAEGESGPEARPTHPDWFRNLRDACAVTGVPFHLKQWGEWAPDGNGRKQDVGEGPTRYRMVRVGVRAAGRTLDGVEHNGFPA